ncbi:MAG: GldG family protein [Thermosynechococcaceae cyanobacterium]
MKRSLPRLKGFSKLAVLLLWLGVFLMMAGLCAGLISGTWSTVPVGLFIGGLVVLGVWILLHWQYSPQSSGSWWRRRSIQAGSNAFVAATSVIVILGLINFLAVRYPAKLDLTEAKIFSLAPQSKQMVRALDQSLKVMVFNNAVDPQKRTLLEQYQRLNPNRFEFAFVDPQAQPGLAQKYKVKVAGTVVLDLAGRSKTLDSDLSEVSLTAAIAALVSDRKTQVFIMQGHGEMPISGAQASLADAIEAMQKQGFKIDLLNFAERKQIPAETDVLIVAGPKRAFLPAEVQLLEAYMQQGGRALFMLDPETEHSLDGFLKKWGITLDERLVVDASGSGQLLGLGPAVPIVIAYGPHPITKDFAQGLTYYPIAQSLNFQQIPGQEMTELLRTGEGSWAESNPDSEQLQFDPKTDRQGPLVLGVAVEKAPPEQKASPTATPSSAPSATPSSAPTATPQPSSATPPISSPSSPTPSPAASPSASPTASVSPTASASPTASISPPTPAASPSSPPPVSSSASSPNPSEPTKPPVSQSPARLVVIGDSDFSSSGPFKQVLNGDLFLNAVTWLGDDDESASLSIRPKVVTNRRLDITPRRRQFLSALGVLLPVSALGVAVTLWWQRR